MLRWTMIYPLKSVGEIFFFINLFQWNIRLGWTEKVINGLTSNFSCYTCVEPLVGYSKLWILWIIFYSDYFLFSSKADHPNSCRFFNTSSTLGTSYIQGCQNDNYTGEYECRKLIISYRSIDTYMRRDCVPKGLCTWKDRTKAMETTPVSDCVYTNDSEQKLECVYCCDTPLCNRTNSNFVSWLLLGVLFFVI